MPEGGLLERFIEESVYQLIIGGLTDLGWFLPGRQHEPIVPIQGPTPTYESIQKNTLVVNLEVTEDEEYEMGSPAAIEDAYTAYADFYAEDLSVGRHVAGDIRGILRGTMPSINRDNNVLDIYAYDQATPTVIGYAIIASVRGDQNSMFSRPWKATLYSTQFVLQAPTFIEDTP